MSYTMNCSCGDSMTIEAENKEQAVAKLADIMNEDSIARHMELNHPGEPIPSTEQTHAMIEQNLRAAERQTQ